MPFRSFLCAFLAATFSLAAAAATAGPVEDCHRLAANPNDPARVGEGVVFDDIDSAAAITACLEAVDANPEDGQLVYQLGRAYDKGGDFDAAENAYLRADELGYARARLNLGYLYAEGSKRDPEKAMHWWRLAADGGEPEAMNAIAWDWAVAGVNLAEAETYSRRSLELAPDDPVYLDTLGWILFKSGRTEEATATLEEAVRLDPQSAGSQAHLGWVYDALGRSEDARAAFERALQLPPPTADEDATFDKEAIEKRLGEMT